MKDESCCRAKKAKQNREKKKQKIRFHERAAKNKEKYGGKEKERKKVKF